MLITGARSGLGKFLSENVRCTPFSRQSNFLNIKGRHFEAVVHCAFNTENSPTYDRLDKYTYDNIILTHKLLTDITFDRFIFISSIDVYPSDLPDKTENIELNINDIGNIYGQTKLMSERMVSAHPNHLILRCGGIIGPDKFPRSILNIKNNKYTTLSKTSVLSYVHQQTILDIIKSPPSPAATGIFNVISKVPMYITELEELYGNIDYGNYVYQASNVPTTKLTTHYPHIQLSSSKDVLFSILKNT